MEYRPNRTSLASETGQDVEADLAAVVAQGEGVAALPNKDGAAAVVVVAAAADDDDDGGSDSSASFNIDTVIPAAAVLLADGPTVESEVEAGVDAEVEVAPTKDDGDDDCAHDPSSSLNTNTGVSFAEKASYAEAEEVEAEAEVALTRDHEDDDDDDTFDSKFSDTSDKDSIKNEDSPYLNFYDTSDDDSMPAGSMDEESMEMEIFEDTTGEDSMDEDEVVSLRGGATSRPTLGPKSASQVGFSQIENLETGSVNSLGTHNPSDYDSDDNRANNREKSVVGFASVRNMVTGSRIRLDAQAIEASNEDSVSASSASAASASVGSVSVAETAGSTLSTGSSRGNTFKYRVTVAQPLQPALPPRKEEEEENKQNLKSLLKPSSFANGNNFGNQSGPRGYYPTDNTSSAAVPAVAAEVTKSRFSEVSGGQYTRLSKISAKYDLDGDGKLDEVEQAMRNRDIDGDGHLDNNEVRAIVQDHLKTKSNYKLYKRVVAGLVCLVVILSVSGFGTSMAAAILTEDTVADKDSGTIQTTSGEVVGFQEVAFEFDLDPLTDEEFDERRRLVDAEMAEDPNHPDHIHRRLGRKGKMKNGAGAQVNYDNVQVNQKDLEDMANRCQGGNIVSIRRRWRDDNVVDDDVKTLCNPGTELVRKKKRTNNKKRKKAKVVDEQVTFRKHRMNGEDASIVFDCNGGKCHGSGAGLQQEVGHPCQLSRDRDTSSECMQGFVCYRAGSPNGGDGVGSCTFLSEYAREEQICNMDYGVDACESGLACLDTMRTNSRMAVRGVRKGICSPVRDFSREGGVCDVAHGDDACVNDYRCLSANGREIGNAGIGYCMNTPTFS